MKAHHRGQVFLVSSPASEPQPNYSAHFELFSNLLTTCGYDKNYSEPESLPKTAGQDLIFLDASTSDRPMDVYRNHDGVGRWIMFNLEPGAIDESDAIIEGMEGAFYHNDSPELILKGLRRLEKMDVWFKRMSINEALRRMRDTGKFRRKAIANGTANSQNHSVNPNLTKREVTIIELVSKGCQNQEIADQLHISVNTVKTHIYSIFRKTQSRNRIELLAWTQAYFHDIA